MTLPTLYQPLMPLQRHGEVNPSQKHIFWVKYESIGISSLKNILALRKFILPKLVNMTAISPNMN